MKKCVPCTGGKKEQRRRPPLWTNEAALLKVKKKHQAFRRYMETRDGQDYLLYARARNQAKQACRIAVKEHEKNIARNAKTNPKAFYAYARSKLKTREGIADLKDARGNTAKTEQAKAHMLNEFFCSVFTREDVSKLPNFTPKVVHEELSSITITEEEVKKKLKTLKIDKSPGPDSFHPRVLREAAE